jgi:integrase
VSLAKWANCTIDPHTKPDAVKVLNRMIAAIDNKTFDPAGERPVIERPADTLATLVSEWETHHAHRRGLTSNSLKSVLNLIVKSKLGSYTLADLVAHPKDIEDWLNATGDRRKWKNKTWNDYRGLLFRILKKGVAWKRLSTNPVADIEVRVAEEPEHFKHRTLDEEVEDRLFAAVVQLNRPQHRPTKTTLTQDDADAIRAQLAEGKRGVDVARAFTISPAVVSAIKHGDIWNPVKYTVGTKGTEMERRLIGAFDAGLRAGEMQQLQLRHVNWRLETMDDVQGYVITLPPSITNGGKSTGKPEEVFAATQRFRQLLERRRFQLKNNPMSKTYIFGTEDGRRQKGFRGLWRELFTFAGLDYGRGKGLVWHTIRHEYISRLVERTKGDAVLVQTLARHKNLETTQGYIHTRRSRQLAAAASLDRR